MPCSFYLCFFLFLSSARSFRVSTSRVNLKKGKSLSLSLYKSGDFPESAIPSRENNNNNERRMTKENRGKKRVVVVAAVAATEHES